MKFSEAHKHKFPYKVTSQQFNRNLSSHCMSKGTRRLHSHCSHKTLIILIDFLVSLKVHSKLISADRRIKSIQPYSFVIFPFSKFSFNPQ